MSSCRSNKKREENSLIVTNKKEPSAIHWSRHCPSIKARKTQQKFSRLMKMFTSATLQTDHTTQMENTKTTTDTAVFSERTLSLKCNFMFSFVGFAEAAAIIHTDKDEDRGADTWLHCGLQY